MAPRKTVKHYEKESSWVGSCLISPKYNIARRVWQLRHNKKLPRKTCVCHTCDNPHCIFDGHHFLGTQKVNVHDSMKKGRHTSVTKPPVLEETRLKLSKSLKGRPSPMKGRHHSDETKEKLSLAALGRKYSPEFGKKLSSALTGRVGSFKGRKHTAEAKARISASVKRQHERQRRMNAG